MTLEYIVQKIRQLQFEERRLIQRGDRERLTDHRRNMRSWYSRLAREIQAIPQRRLAELPGLIRTASDPRQILDLKLEGLRLHREIATLNVDREIQRLLS